MSDATQIYVNQVSKLLDACGYAISPSAATFISHNFAIDTKPVMVSAFLLAHTCANHVVNSRDPILLVRNAEIAFTALSFIKSLNDSGALSQVEWHVVQTLFAPFAKMEGCKKHSYSLFADMGDTELLIFVGEASPSKKKAENIIADAYQQYSSSHDERTEKRIRNWRSPQEIEDDIEKARSQNRRKIWGIF